MSNSRLLLALVTLCSACGSLFDAGGTGGTSGSVTDAGSTGSNAGNTSSGGAATGGTDGESGAGAGGHSTGGAATAGTGGSSAGGASVGGASVGGASAGSGGAGAGGSGGATAGAGGAADCATLKTDYAAALQKARVCDKASIDQCSTSSTLPTLGCGCPTLVNAKSLATTLAKEKYKAFQDAKCSVGPICNIACLAYTGATCSAATMGNTFVCTGSQGLGTK